MLSQVLFQFFIFKFCVAQLNGEFWWLNDKLAKFQGVRPPPPKFERLAEFDTDDSAKIVFRDDNLLLNNNEEFVESTNNKGIEDKTSDEFPEHVVKWPEQEKKKTDGDISDLQSVEELNESPDEIGDKFVFKFPDNDNIMWKYLTSTNAPSPMQNKSNSKINPTDTPVLYNDKISLKNNHKEKESESICSFMKKAQCLRQKGIALNDKATNQTYYTGRHLVCCVLPLHDKSQDEGKITFPDTLKKMKRPKRSNQENTNQRQRNNLRQRKHGQSRRSKQKTLSKIESSDYEYDDPYWNVKNTKHGNKNKQETEREATRYDYDSTDYTDEYVSEVPVPGLTGIYSDIGRKPSDWRYGGGQNNGYGENDDYDDDNSGAFGYSTIDPRIGNNKNKDKKSRPRGKPQRLTTTTTSDESRNPESHTISYQAKPDFNVLQDFKLHNIMRYKNKTTKRPRSTTTVKLSDNDSKEPVLNRPYDSSESSTENFDNRQVFKNCGKAPKPLFMKVKDKQIFDTTNGSHPWLAMVVPTRSFNVVQCYATLVHPRAVITAADCVHRSAPGDISVIVGLWNLNERTRLKSRVISYSLHPEYKNGGLTNNLAILYWKKPVRLGFNIQPACLKNPKMGDECWFVGWGGFDQAMRPNSQWQRASVHTCSGRLSLNGIKVPAGAFCASVEARSTVTGIGGSVMCNVGDQLYAVGVAVTRDSTLVLLPAHDWALQAISVIDEA
ncbi:unnamed protein product [Chrysodeixis includens]|uniref:Peptidase S1 domain-containing protein n=1 Tax=Chrysodeixis includens TaxID=689277 RepID=A0A9P0C2H6_CHRIL|nr:unnamed protein product [Chrysodeixis includens]